MKSSASITSRKGQSYVNSLLSLIGPALPISGITMFIVQKTHLTPFSQLRLILLGAGVSTILSCGAATNPEVVEKPNTIMEAPTAPTPVAAPELTPPPQPPTEPVETVKEEIKPEPPELAVGVRQKNAHRIFDRAKRALRKKHYQEGLSLLLEAYEVFPHRFIGYNLANVLVKNGDQEKACEYWRLIEGKIRKHRTEIQLEIAICELSEAKGEAALRRLYELKPIVRKRDLNTFLILYGDGLLQTGRVGEAWDLAIPIVQKKRLKKRIKPLAQSLKRRLEIARYGFALETQDRQKSAEFVDRAQALRVEKRYQASFGALQQALRLQSHPKQIELRDVIVLEWLSNLSNLRGNLARPLQELASTLETMPLPVSLRTQIGETIALGAQTELKTGNRRMAGILAEQARAFEDTAITRRILVEALSTSQNVYVPRGTYPIGTRAGDVRKITTTCNQEIGDPSRCREIRFQGETEHHSVALTAFYISRNEVSVAQFKTCVDAGICGRAHFDVASPCPFEDRNGENLPMSCVDWSGAAEYCRFVGGRLPTEAEWEGAGADYGGRAYPWGQDTPDSTRANFADRTAGNEGTAFPFDRERDDGHARSAPVGSFPRGATPTGIQDLSGNVAEWTADWFRPSGYPPAAGLAAPKENPQGPCNGRSPCPGHTKRVVKGAGYTAFPVEMRNQSRSGVRPGEVFPWLGFRCVWTP
jgi:formylglycine-generating enzyme required for sulfatase activity